MKYPTDEFTRMDEEVRYLSDKIHKARYIFLFFFVIITVRLWYLQIYKGPVFRKYSENNRLKKNNIQAPRGLILSRNQNILASNHIRSELTLTPQHAKNIQKTAKIISPIIEIPAETIAKKIKKSKKERGLFFPISLKKELNLKQIHQLKLMKEQLPELNIQEYIVRFYPFKEKVSHLLGHTGQASKKQILKSRTSFAEKFHLKAGDTIGQSGIEKYFDHEIRGLDGVFFIEVDAHSRYVVSHSELFTQPYSKDPIPGHHIVLTLDTDIQNATFQAMQRTDKIGIRKGAAIAMKTNGEILAWVSSPSFDPNVFSNVLSSNYWKLIKQNSSQSLLNKVIQNHYAPGSLIKPIVALAALEENVITTSSFIESPSKIRLGRRFFYDHNPAGYGLINLFEALEQSSNTFFYQIGQELTIDQISKYADLFGFGKKTNIQIHNEISGFVPTRQWKKNTLKESWQKGEDLVHAIGQGYLLVTPLQVAVAYNAIATDGLLVQPFVTQSIIDSNNKVIKTFSSQITDNLSKRIQSKHFHSIRNALKEVIHGSKGTARWWKLKNSILAGGKTGTSQVRSFNQTELYQDCMHKPIQDRHHGWFASFAPLEKPEVVVVVLTEHSCAGSSGSAPIAKDILDAYFKKYPNNQNLNQKEQTS